MLTFKVAAHEPIFCRLKKKTFTCRLVCGEFRQVCDKIGVCRAISDSARSQNVCRLVCGGQGQFVRARARLNQLGNAVRVASVESRRHLDFG